MKKAFILLAVLLISCEIPLQYEGEYRTYTINKGEHFHTNYEKQFLNGRDIGTGIHLDSVKFYNCIYEFPDGYRGLNRLIGIASHSLNMNNVASIEWRPTQDLKGFEIWAVVGDVDNNNISSSLITEVGEHEPLDCGIEYDNVNRCYRIQACGVESICYTDINRKHFYLLPTCFGGKYAAPQTLSISYSIN